MKTMRFWIVCLLLAATAVLLQSRDKLERHVASEPLSQFPTQIDGRIGIEQPIDQETLQVLGNGDFLSRVYDRDGQTAPIGLFIAYFASQRTGSAIHSPKHCLPGAGWVFESSQYADLKDTNGKSHRLGEYIIAQGDNRDFVIYWYQAHGRSFASEYKAALYGMKDSILMNRTDAALVRVITPIDGNRPNGTSIARMRAEAFVGQLWPTLPRFIPN